MNEKDKQQMFKEMGVKTFYIGECREGPKKTTVMLEEPEKDYF